MGQWWWHYDSLTGNVFQRYPVYAVHQHGMAPMALFALADAARLDFSQSICNGLAWIYGGNNELAVDLLRCVFKPGYGGAFFAGTLLGPTSRNSRIF